MTIKIKDLQNLGKKELERKIVELKLELIKSQAGKAGSKSKEIKKVIARILTLNNSNK